MIQRNGLWFLIIGILLPIAFAQEKKPKEFPDFKKIVTDEFQKIEGYYTIHRHKEKDIAFLEIPAGALEKDFLLATTISGGSRYTGWLWSDSLLYWKRYGKQLALLERQLQYRTGDPSSPVGTSVTRTYKDTLLTTFNIETLNGGNPVLSLNSMAIGQVSTFFGGMFSFGNRGLVKYVQLKAFPQNIEISVEGPDRRGNFITLHYSIRDLPTSDYKPREADDRIGYFYRSHKDLTNGKMEDGLFVHHIQRWNLKKQDPKLAKSPVVEPIIFYVEKTVPIKYRHVVREAIEEWNKAFEKVGFLNAVVVRQQTSTNEFKDLDPADSRYSFFRWITSGRAFARGPSRVDPRTGQVLDADIVFDDSYAKFRLVEYENYLNSKLKESLSPNNRFLKKLTTPQSPKNEKIHQTDQAIEKWLANQENSHCTQCNMGEELFYEYNLGEAYLGLLNDEKKPEGGKTPEEDSKWVDEFLRQAIKQTVMHEVGHTLGLRHNFKASSWLSLTEINAKENPPAAFTASVMEYTPLNLKGNEKDATQGNYFMTELGPYDFWAIEYGYTPSEDPKELAKIASQSAKPEHVFGTDEDVASADPFLERWDLGDDLLAYAHHRIGIAQKVLKNLTKVGLNKGTGYQSLRRYFSVVLGEHYRASQTVIRYLGGEEVNRDHYGDPDGRDPVEVVESSKQREALDFISKHIFSKDAFQFEQDILTKLAPDHWRHWGTRGRKEFSYDLYYRISWIQNAALATVFDSGVLARIHDAELKSKEDDILTIPEVFSTIRESIWSELKEVHSEVPTNQKPLINGARRNLQQEHLESLKDWAMSQYSTPVSARTLAWHELKLLKADIDNALKTINLSQDTYSRAHLEIASKRIEKILTAYFQR